MKINIWKSKRTLSQYDREQLAEDAFWGTNKNLMNHILKVLSYPSNGFTEEEATNIINNMSDKELKAYIK